MEPQIWADRLVRWLKEQVEKAGAKGTVVGLSGGIDSAVTAVLCRHAFPETSLCLVLPCESVPADLEDACLVAERCNLRTRVITLDAVYRGLTELLAAVEESDGDDAASRLARANLKARLRMGVLYYFANRLNCLVVGTGNRSELAVGYFTKYGDGGVDILPLGTLTKGEVWQLARHLGIPAQIVEKPPSAGLWPGQTDEGEMGLTYEELDAYLLTGKGTESVKNVVEARRLASRHKLEPPPVPHFQD